jgi:hypothetical protein
LECDRFWIDERVPPPLDLEALLFVDLKLLGTGLLTPVGNLTRTVFVSRDEIARLKNLPGHATLKPGGMAMATQPKPSAGKGRRQFDAGRPGLCRVHAERLVRRLERQAPRCPTRLPRRLPWPGEDLGQT